MTPNIFTNNFWIISSIYILATFIKASLLIHIVDKYSFTSVSFLLMSEPLADSIHEIIVIKICGLDKDIQEAIKKRGDDDITLVQKTTLELD